MKKKHERECVCQNSLIRIKNQTDGITLIALIITIALNCWRSGRNKVNNLLKYNKMILKKNEILENI